MFKNDTVNNKTVNQVKSCKLDCTAELWNIKNLHRQTRFVQFVHITSSGITNIIHKNVLVKSNC